MLDLEHLSEASEALHGCEAGAVLAGELALNQFAQGGHRCFVFLSVHRHLLNHAVM
jgi:hypothetical protein